MPAGGVQVTSLERQSMLQNFDSEHPCWNGIRNRGEHLFFYLNTVYLY